MHELPALVFPHQPAPQVCAEWRAIPQPRRPQPTGQQLMLRSFAEQRRLTEAVGTYRAFEAAVRDGRLEEAFQFCTEQCRRKNNLAELQEALKLAADAETEAMTKGGGFSSDSEMKQNADCTEVTFDDSFWRRGESRHQSVRLIREGDAWLVDDVKVIAGATPPRQRP